MLKGASVNGEVNETNSMKVRHSNDQDQKGQGK